MQAPAPKNTNLWLATLGKNQRIACEKKRWQSLFCVSTLLQRH